MTAHLQNMPYDIKQLTL